jgi:transcriptional/translational regulatory protein YebC/TACO1
MHFETVTYEGFAPHGVPVIVECLTDNKNRTASSMRVRFRGGQQAASGAVSWDFQRCGLIEATPPAGGEDPEDAALEAEADDVSTDEEGTSSFVTAPGDLHAVARALTERGWTTQSASLVWMPNNPVELEADQRTEVEAWLEAMDDDDDVQKLFVGLAG